MTSRHQANTNKAVESLLNLIEQRFSLRLPTDFDHLKSICEHYTEKRKLILWEQGHVNAYKNAEYAKAVLISEIARLVLREIDPWPRRKKIKRK